MLHVTALRCPPLSQTPVDLTSSESSGLHHCQSAAGHRGNGASVCNAPGLDPLGGLDALNQALLSWIPGGMTQQLLLLVSFGAVGAVTELPSPGIARSFWNIASGSTRPALGSG